MAKLHHATLKAAVAAFAILLAQGKSESEIKDAISKHEKGFEPDEVEEIYQSILSESQEGSTGENQNQSEQNKAGSTSGDGSGSNNPPVNNPPTLPPVRKEYAHIVIEPFRDINNWEVEYAVGDDVSEFEKGRLNHLVSIGKVEKVEK